MLNAPPQLSIPQIEARVLKIAGDVSGLRPNFIQMHSRVIQDLHCDSISFLDLFMRLEDAFDITLPFESEDALLKSVFTRNPLRLSDFVEAVYLRQGTGSGRRKRRFYRNGEHEAARAAEPFTQLGGEFREEADRSRYEPLGNNRQGHAMHRRMRDGMVCVAVPGAEVIIGNDAGGNYSDEAPAHRVGVDEFLIDREPVSTTAYARFLNSIGSVDAEVLEDWFVLSPEDRRNCHALLEKPGGRWTPVAGTERLPMMLVSWYGANAYSLWANAQDWKGYGGDTADGETFLPSEAQWEYAARGSDARKYPWGDDEPDAQRMQFAQHVPGRTYEPTTLPMAEVHADLGVSPFGLRHMAGNVWQWCRDWYAPNFYQSPKASRANPVNDEPTTVRSERGGSWIGADFLCRSSYRRGRAPSARGRCLGFRCIGKISDLSTHAK